MEGGPHPPSGKERREDNRTSAQRVLRGRIQPLGYLRGWVRDAYLTLYYLWLCAQGRAPVSASTQNPGQEHDAAFEHDHLWHGAVASRRRGDHRPSLRNLRREGAPTEPRARTDRGDGQSWRSQAKTRQGARRAAGLQTALSAGLLSGLQPNSASLRQD